MASSSSVGDTSSPTSTFRNPCVAPLRASVWLIAMDPLMIRRIMAAMRIASRSASFSTPIESRR